MTPAQAEARWRSVRAYLQAGPATTPELVSHLKETTSTVTCQLRRWERKGLLTSRVDCRSRERMGRTVRGKIRVWALANMQEKSCD